MSGENNSESDPTLDDTLEQGETMIDAAPDNKQKWLKPDEMPTLDKLAARCVMATGLTALTPRLTAQESFCELLRWWKDKIMESSGLQLTDFVVTMKRRGNHSDAKIPAEIAFTAQDGSGKPLGYVHFMNSRDGKGGTVTVAVRDVTPLQPSMVVPNLERPKEPQDVRFTHRSELGLGRAVLNFLGAGTNHGVTCRTGGYKYRFNFGPEGQLMAVLTVMDQVKNNEFRRLTVPKGSRYVPFQPHPETDTVFVIGVDRDALGRGGRGKYIYRSKVTPREFNIWCEPALFLQDMKDADIVKTEVGDLILDSKSRGKIYFKGFLLSDTTRRGYASLSERPLRFGYNILYGTPDERMKHMSSLEEECRAIISLLDDWGWGDVELAVQFIKKDTISLLGDYLFLDRSKWYYPTGSKLDPECEKNLSKFGRQAVELLDSYYSILAPYKTVNRKLYEYIPRVLNEEPVSIPDTQFAAFVDKALRSCLSACKHTETLSVMFFDARRLPHWTVLVDDNVVSVPDKWLDQGSLGLIHNILGGDELLSDLMKSVPSILLHFVLKQVPIDEESCDRHKTIARQRLKDYAQEELNSKMLNLSFEPGSRSNLANVSWETTLSPRNVSNYHVQLHQTETCWDHQNAVLVQDILSTTLTCINDTCHISEVIITKGFRRYCIKDCILGEEYFGIVYNPDEPLSIPLVTSTFTVPMDVSTADDYDVEMALEDPEDLQNQLSS
ncbi:uncharacterized protein FFB20_06497 [Fusarium fujikuroi]|uniref:Uncharacterized protein n=2 Tax=Fusarium fujikuroi TaxID=5127 RepID=S0DUL9_GIBF5|nr:uncharacterized protein FFUJ_03309 [Fusarium fujikuroi IMI 58289]KLO94776.1 uncharacterized protein Y057_4502 [Fusarium fujikuroi]KLP20576.1 uncharacterized protein LW94_3283 [Fusarium fujikuroi]CCT66294.1 uncharacterized protein FFUJ_03309 [Fusarium fujikuroi IMI 58289]SCN78633.1 uncharacterized protein FFE2_04153 [Fusarium fujikuroi]SCN80677.1 uncharacterized protein FFM5_02487 [Fusarium fujikuroi]